LGNEQGKSIFCLPNLEKFSETKRKFKIAVTEKDQFSKDKGRTFVNPLPGIKIHKILGFDFPAHPYYHAIDCPSNLNSAIEPEKHDVYGRLGYPPREQGFPLMRENIIEPITTKLLPYHDQIVDRDREANIFHTGRLSGSFVQYIVQPNHKSRVKMHIRPLDHDGPVVTLYDLEVPLVAGGNIADTWFWLDSNTRNELIYTANAVISKGWHGMKPGIYKLIVHWEFWDYKDQKNKTRMPMSGFCDAISFELVEETGYL